MAEKPGQLPADSELWQQEQFPFSEAPAGRNQGRWFLLLHLDRLGRHRSFGHHLLRDRCGRGWLSCFYPGSHLFPLNRCRGSSFFVKATLSPGFFEAGSLVA